MESQEGEKKCSVCNEVKMLRDFYKNKTIKDGRQSCCKRCQHLLNKKYRGKDVEKSRAKNRANASMFREKNRDKFYEILRRNRLKSKYGLTAEQYDRILEYQNGKCAILSCGATPESEGRRLAVDHNHATGDVRGLLCSRHNRGIGSFRDNADDLKETAGYLDSPPARRILGLQREAEMSSDRFCHTFLVQAV